MRANAGTETQMECFPDRVMPQDNPNQPSKRYFLRKTPAQTTAKNGENFQKVAVQATLFIAEMCETDKGEKYSSLTDALISARRY